MDRMKHELRQYLSRKGRGTATRILRAEGLNRNWIKDALGKPWNWQPERAEILDAYVCFSDQAWDEAYAIWGDMALPPFNRAQRVRELKANPPVWNWAA